METDTCLQDATPRAGAVLAAGEDTVFDYDLFLADVELLPPGTEMPPEQWQRALAYRQLTPQEQAARERYFERKSAEALARMSQSTCNL